MSGPVDVLAVALFEAFSRNSGNPPDCHYDRNAAEQWMAQALDECGVAELIEADEEYDAAVTAHKDLVRRIAEQGWYEIQTDALRNAGVRTDRAQARRAAALAGVGGAK